MRNVKALAFLAGSLFSSPAFAEFEVKDTLSLNLQNVETAYICNASKAKFVLLEAQYFNGIRLPTFRPSSARSDKLELKVMEFDTVLYVVDKPNLAVSNVGADDALWLFGDTGYYRAFGKIGSMLVLHALGEPEERVYCDFDKPESYVKKLDDFAWKYSYNTYQAYADSLTSEIENFKVDGVQLGSVKGQQLPCIPRAQEAGENALGMEIRRIDVTCAVRNKDGYTRVIFSSDKQTVVQVRRSIVSKANISQIEEQLISQYGKPDEEEGRDYNWGKINKSGDDIGSWTGVELSVEVSSCYDSWSDCTGRGYEIELDLTDWTKLNIAREEGRAAFKAKHSEIEF